MNEAKVGKEYKVLFDRYEGGYAVGRTEFDSPDVDNEVLVKITDEQHIRLGDYAMVRIDSADHYDLHGTLLS
jgi:ribosomal protein S12 methylthiotransferase